MRTVWWAIVAMVSVTRAQEDAASLAWSGVGEAAGEARALGPCQPASLARESPPMVALSVVPSIYGMGELRSGAVGLAVGRDGYGYGAAVSMLEAGSVRFLRAKGALGVELISGIALGLGGAIGQWSFPRYTPLLEWEGAMGVQLQSDQVTTGILVTARGQEGRTFPAERVRVSMGGSVRLSEAITAIAEVADGARLEVQMGARVMVLEEMSFILSWSDGTSCVGGGCEITAGAWQLLAAARWHPILGWSHGVTLGHAWR